MRRHEGRGFRHRLAGTASVLAALALLALPGGAPAATFYVDDDATAPAAPCVDPDPAQACTTILSAVIQARATAPGPHAIRIAPGRYVEEIWLNQAADEGLSIEGAGAGGEIADPSTQTILEYGNDDGFNDPALDVDRQGITVRGLRVEVPNGPAYSGDPGLELGAADTAVEDTRVEVREPTAGVALRLGGARARAERVIVTTVTTNSDAIGIFGSVEDVLVRDVFARNASGRAGSSQGLNSVRIVRSTFSSGGDGNGFFASFGSATLESSLLLGGGTGIDAYQANVIVRHSTIDAGDPKLADADDRGLRARADSPNQSAISLIDSIVLEQQVLGQGGHKTITCERSDVPHQVDAAPNEGTGSIDCPATPGNGRGNQTSTPAQLFVPEPLDWRLRVGSPAVDAGAAGLAPGEEGLDLADHPRIADGDRNGSGVSDMGAYELHPCAGLPATIVALPGAPIQGTASRDVILGTPSRDLIRALAGDDVVCGRGGRDRILGGRGADRLLGDAGADSLLGQGGGDRLRGGKGNDKLFGGDGRDRLLGGPGRDRLFGGRGGDVLLGGKGRDLLRGGPGRDKTRQ